MCPLAFCPPTNSRVNQPGSIDALLVDSVDEVLGCVLGVKTRDAVYARLAIHYSLEVQGIPGNLRKFSRVLEEMLGRGGKTVGYAICRKLFEKLGWTFTEVEGFDFLDYVEGAKVKLAQQSIKRLDLLSNNNFAEEC